MTMANHKKQKKQSEEKTGKRVRLGLTLHLIG